MASSISFPLQQMDVFERDCICFPALADGKKFSCFVSSEALTGYFGAARGGEMPVFMLNRSSFEVLAAEKISKGDIENDEVLITTKDFR